MRIALTLCLALMSSTAFGQEKIRNLSSGQQALPTASLPTSSINTACQADPTTVVTASLTCAAFELNMQGFTRVWLLIEYTFSTASAIQIFQDGALDTSGNKSPDTPWGIIQRPEAAGSGQVNLFNEFASKPVSASTAMIVEYTVNSPFVRWRYTSVGGSAGDTVRVFVIRRGP